MKKITFLSVLLVLSMNSSCTEDEYSNIPESVDLELASMLDNISEKQGFSFFKLPDSDDLENIPQDPKNPITKEKVALGKFLMHETGTAQAPKVAHMRGTYSCASCHQHKAGFSAGVRQGIGECGIGYGVSGEARVIDPSVAVALVDIQPIKSPTILNVAYQDVMLWNGQFGGTGTNQGTEASWDKIPENFLGLQGVEVQAIKGQGVHRLKIDSTVVKELGYTALFDKAFSDIAVADRYTTHTAALAIAAYERTVMANKSSWQSWLRGERDALSITEKKGAIVFFGKGKCFECHTGPALNDQKFHAFGMGDFDNTNTALVVDTEGFENVKKGRGGFTKKKEDDYKFKTPTLYNLADQRFYGHGGTFTSIRDVIVYKNNGIPQNPNVSAENLAPQFGAIDLTDQEIQNLTEFITNALRDPELDRYTPDVLPSGACFPNNDMVSREDLGCSKNEINY